MTRLVRPVNKKLQNFTAQKYGTQMDDRQLLTNSLHTCGYPRVLCFILNPILLNRERNFVLVGGMDLTAATFRLQYENDYEYEFSVLSTHFKFERRKLSKCACSELETRIRRRPRTPIWRSLVREASPLLLFVNFTTYAVGFFPFHDMRSKMSNLLQLLVSHYLIAFRSHIKMRECLNCRNDIHHRFLAVPTYKTEDFFVAFCPYSECWTKTGALSSSYLWNLFLESLIAF